jgi:hypothetical protein
MHMAEQQQYSGATQYRYAALAIMLATWVVGIFQLFKFKF